MLFLLFQLGADRYALETAQVVEVLPLVNLKLIPRAPAGVAGAFNYHGAALPVLDLTELNFGRPSPTRLSTRIILANYPSAAGRRHLLGLMAERAVETVRLEPSAFTSLGVTVDQAPYLGPVIADERGLIQWIKIADLLPEDVRGALFRQPIELMP